MGSDWILYGGYLLVIALLVPWAQFVGGGPWSFVQEATSSFLGARFEQGVYPEPYRWVVDPDMPVIQQVVVELAYNLVLILFWIGCIIVPYMLGVVAWSYLVAGLVK